MHSLQWLLPQGGWDSTQPFLQLVLINNRTLLPSTTHLHCLQSHELSPRRSQGSPFSGWRSPYFQLLASPRKQRIVQAETEAMTTLFFFSLLWFRNKCTEELKQVVERRVQRAAALCSFPKVILRRPLVFPSEKKQTASRATFKMCAFDPFDRDRSV